jgi:hypothetical protein
MDRLHVEVSAIVQDAARSGEPALRTHERIRDAAFACSGRTAQPTRFPPARAVVPAPRMTEPWFC